MSGRTDSSSKEEKAMKRKVTEVKNILPTHTTDDIEFALMDNNMDVQRAIEALMDDGFEKAETAGSKKKGKAENRRREDRGDFRGGRRDDRNNKRNFRDDNRGPPDGRGRGRGGGASRDDRGGRGKGRGRGRGEPNGNNNAANNNNKTNAGPAVQPQQQPQQPQQPPKPTKPTLASIVAGPPPAAKPPPPAAATPATQPAGPPSADSQPTPAQAVGRSDPAPSEAAIGGGRGGGRGRGRGRGRTNGRGRGRGRGATPTAATDTVAQKPVNDVWGNTVSDKSDAQNGWGSTTSSTTAAAAPTDEKPTLSWASRVAKQQEKPAPPTQTTQPPATSTTAPATNANNSKSSNKPSKAATPAAEKQAKAPAPAEPVAAVTANLEATTISSQPPKQTPVSPQARQQPQHSQPQEKAQPQTTTASTTTGQQQQQQQSQQQNNRSHPPPINTSDNMRSIQRPADRGVVTMPGSPPKTNMPVQVKFGNFGAPSAVPSGGQIASEKPVDVSSQETKSSELNTAVVQQPQSRVSAPIKDPAVITAQPATGGIRTTSIGQAQSTAPSSVSTTSTSMQTPSGAVSSSTSQITSMRNGGPSDPMFQSQIRGHAGGVGFSDASSGVGGGWGAAGLPPMGMPQYQPPMFPATMLNYGGFEGAAPFYGGDIQQSFQHGGGNRDRVDIGVGGTSHAGSAGSTGYQQQQGQQQQGGQNAQQQQQQQQQQAPHQQQRNAQQQHSQHHQQQQQQSSRMDPKYNSRSTQSQRSGGGGGIGGSSDVGGYNDGSGLPGNASGQPGSTGGQIPQQFNPLNQYMFHQPPQPFPYGPQGFYGANFGGYGKAYTGMNMGNFQQQNAYNPAVSSSQQASGGLDVSSPMESRQQGAGGSSGGYQGNKPNMFDQGGHLPQSGQQYGVGQQQQKSASSLPGGQKTSAISSGGAGGGGAGGSDYRVGKQLQAGGDGLQDHVGAGAYQQVYGTYGQPQMMPAHQYQQPRQPQFQQQPQPYWQQNNVDQGFNNN